MHIEPVSSLIALIIFTALVGLALFLIGKNGELGRRCEWLELANNRILNELQRWQNLAVKRTGYDVPFPEVEPPQLIRPPETHQSDLGDGLTTSVVGYMRPPIAQSELEWEREQESKRLTLSELNKAESFVPPLSEDYKKKLRERAANAGRE